MRAFWLAALLMVVALGAPRAASAAEAISCFDVEERTEPGASDYCAPIRLTNEEAFKALQNLQKLGLRKIGFDYFMITTEPFPPDLVWKVLAVGVSAIQTLYGANADIYVMRPPSARGEELFSLFGEVPEHLLLGRARYVWPVPEKLSPPGPDHFDRFYVLIVY